MIKRICTFYFSATGTTKKVIKHIAKKLSKNLKVNDIYEWDFTSLKMREQHPTYNFDDLVIVGVPVIAGRVPNLLLPYLSKLKANNTLSIAVVLYGNRHYDDALMELSLIMKKAQMNVIASAAFIGEHSFSKILAKGRPDEKDMKIATQFAEDIAKKIQNHIENTKFDEIFIPGENPIRGYYTPRDRYGNSIDIRKVKPKTNNKCINCKICVNVCPLGSIDYEDVRQINGICMKCCACEKKCPTGAKYFDDANYLYHKVELEEQYTDIRRDVEIYI